ncbi:MAG: 2-C-methyl-D-erythritol 4-phosphate cytidylyltransferase [Alphaproteobacteria bacterium]
MRSSARAVTPAIDAGKRMGVQALIQAAGNGSRLGLGPKAYIVLDGRTLIERAVAIFRDIAEHVIVAVPAAEIARTRRLLGGDRITVIAGGASRSETTRRLVAEATAPWLLLHDVVHPFATTDLVEKVLQTAYVHRAAAPGVANTEFMYGRDGALLFAPGEVLIGQKPVAFSRDAVEAAYKALGEIEAAKDPSLLEILELAGIRTKFVEGSARNIKITGPADLEVAQALIELEKAESINH